MRRFMDRAGVAWDVVLGRESWGASVALFVPPGTSGLPSRQAPLKAVAQDEAVRELDGMNDAALQALLDRSTTRQEGIQ
ncbi:MAG TPA: hypothetical protein VK933_11220 [Longimicrobiales bacterium]|nr:hypothetical protein [Longimicrobiales bacterium]